MKIRQIEYFVAVAEELHFRNAATRLNVSQPPLSQQIQELEKHLGVVLFSREKAGVSLTPAGRRLLPHARRILESIEAASKAARHDVIKALNVGFVSSASPMLAPIIRQIRESFPDIDLRMIEANSARQADMLRSGSIDLALVRGPWTCAGFAREVIAEEQLALILATDHPRAADPDLKLADLADEPFVFFPRELGPGFFDTVVGACSRAGFSPELNQIAGSTLTMIALVASGQGFSLVPARLASVAKGIAALYPSDLNATTVLLAAFHESRRQMEPIPSIIRIFKEFSMGDPSRGLI